MVWRSLAPVWRGAVAGQFFQPVINILPFDTGTMADKLAAKRIMHRVRLKILMQGPGHRIGGQGDTGETLADLRADIIAAVDFAPWVEIILVQPHSGFAEVRQ